jgi:hypothetical protein
MRHAPDRVLVGYQHMVVPPCEAIRAIEILDVAIDPRRLAVALVAQERQVAGALLGDEHVPVRQHEEAAWIGEPGGEERRREAWGHLRHVPFRGQRKRAVGHDRRGFRRRQLGGVDAEAPPDLMLGDEILLEGVLRGGRRLGLRQGGQGTERNRKRQQRCE